ncbi:MAG: RES family NAD+ phosphorylase [Gammaproteobacteria bacterium]|nr:RES family NAD+ phosphorylase [Gammaproteobacteria bacterium]
MSGIWQACAATAAPSTLTGTLWRMVESQEEIATNALVDTLDEQAALERLLDETKPRRPGTERLHYLLATPFRYPPLRHGSRFGRRFEPSLFYGSIHRSALLCEAAYYRLVFTAGPATPFPKPLVTRHTAFSARFRTARGLQLEQPPFADHRAALTSPVDYTATQALGSAMREHGIGAFTFTSARDPQQSLNAALFDPSALADRAPRAQTPWTCETTAERVTWREQRAHEVVTLPREVFLVEGVLPAPAT